MKSDRALGAFFVDGLRQVVRGGPLYWIWMAALSVVVLTGMFTGAVLVLRSMARRWREGDAVDLPTPYGPDAPTGGAA